MKIIAAFSGQGSQYPGMGVSLAQNNLRAKEVYQAGSDILGYDLLDFCQNASQEKLNETIYAQPATFALSVAAWESAKEMMGEIGGVVGHSLGEYAALYAGGAFSLEDGFRLIQARSQAMDQTGKQTPGVMCAIVGSNEEKVMEVCQQVEGFVEPVNFNLSNQTVISGEKEAVQRASDELVESGAKAIPLSVSSAFHTSMMEPAATEFVSKLSGITFHPTQCDFYSNLTGGRLVIEDYPDYFAKQMTSPVRFTDDMKAAKAAGITGVVEFGPKKTVSTFFKKTDRSLAVANLEDFEGLDKLQHFLSQQ